MGMQCEIGLRKKTYNVLAGSVLSVWNQVEAVLTHDGNRRGASTKMQVCHWNQMIQNQLQKIDIDNSTQIYFALYFPLKGGSTKTRRQQENSWNVDTIICDVIVINSINGRLRRIRNYRDNTLISIGLNEICAEIIKMLVQRTSYSTI